MSKKSDQEAKENNHTKKTNRHKKNILLEIRKMDTLIGTDLMGEQRNFVKW